MVIKQSPPHKKQMVSFLTTITQLISDVESESELDSASD